MAIDSLRDVEIMLDGIPLEKVGIIRTTANAIGPHALALAGRPRAKSAGCPPTSFSVRLQNDVLKEFVARGTHIFPPGPWVRLQSTPWYCARPVPRWLPLTACGSHMRQAGGKAKHELGFAIANAIAYSDEAIAAGPEDRGLCPAHPGPFIF